LIVSFQARALRHIYWEARFDSQQETKAREVIRELRRGDFSDCDGLVENVVSRTLFSFRTDKRIFNSFIAIHDLDQWHQIMSRLVRNSRFALSRTIVEEYNDACSSAVHDVLSNGKQAACQSADPTGWHAITLAKQVRRDLKALDRRGRIPAKLTRQIQEIDLNRGLQGGKNPHLNVALSE
jgi:hypothetical protein